MKVSALHILIVCVLLATFSLPAFAGPYQIIDLGDLGRNTSGAYGINEAGQVVGSAYTWSGRSHAFLWEEDKGMVDLGESNEPASSAYRINKHGKSAGVKKDNTNRSRAVRWEAQNNLLDLGAPQLVNAEAYGINDLGQVVGIYNLQAFLWEEGKGMVNIGTLGGPVSWAYGINNKGQIVGRSRTAASSPYAMGNEDHAFIWEAGKGMTDLGTLGGTLSWAFDINEAGQVVGTSFDSKGKNRGFIWEEGKGMRDIGTFGGTTCYARAINNKGQAVGYSNLATGAMRAFVWDENNGMIDLCNLIDPASGWVPFMAYDINDKGWIVGLGKNPQGKAHAFLMKPVVNAIQVAIDIKPHSDDNPINLKSNGTIPVAILGAEDFDPATVNVSTVTLAGAPVAVKGNGQYMASIEYVDEDEYLDLLIHVKMSGMCLSSGDTEAVLLGENYDGIPIEGKDSVTMVQK